MSLRVIKIVLFIVCLLPVSWLTFALFADLLGANPIEAIIRDSGTWALRFLLITLLTTPLRWWTGWNQVIALRRMLGLFTFFYAVVHMLLYLGLDQFFDVNEIIKDIIKRPFITVGFICFMALLPLAITSTNKMVKRLGGKRWKQLHKLTYFIAVAGCLHFYMLVKADKLEPLIYFAIVLGLFAVRIYHHHAKPLLNRTAEIKPQH